MRKSIDGRDVHKFHPRNVLLVAITQHDEEWYEAEVAHDVDHPFFFEHPLDHVPAMFLVEAGRQLGIAIAHLFLGVPRDILFATESFDIRFTAFAELSAPITIRARITDRRYRKGELTHLRLDGVFHQAGVSLGTMGGSCLMLKPAVWHRYRKTERAKMPE